MDPVTQAIVAALSTGATSGVADIAKKAIVDGYGQLKALMRSKLSGHREVFEALEKLEANSDATNQATFTQTLQAISADCMPDLVSAAQALLRTIEAFPKHHIQIAHGTGIAQAASGNAFVFIPDSRDSKE